MYEYSLELGLKNLLQIGAINQEAYDRGILELKRFQKQMEAIISQNNKSISPILPRQDFWENKLAHKRDWN